MPTTRWLKDINFKKKEKLEILVEKKHEKVKDTFGNIRMNFLFYDFNKKRTTKSSYRPRNYLFTQPHHWTWK